MPIGSGYISTIKNHDFDETDSMLIGQEVLATCQAMTLRSSFRSEASSDIVKWGTQ